LLAPLYNRLSDLHAEIGGRFGAERLQAIQAQAESACAFADEDAVKSVATDYLGLDIPLAIQ
jgi:hypothetical protein